MRLALFQPDIPQNLGAMMRLCACLGPSLDVIEPCAFPLSDKTLKRAALDYGGLTDVVRHRSWARFMAAPERAQGRLVLMTTKSDLAYTAFDFAPGDTVLMGQESAGAPDWAHDAAQARLIIPLRPGARSLNVATAAAMVLGEALRQTAAIDGHGGAGRNI